MGQGKELNWGEAGLGMEQVWRCRCWDCMAHRRYVLRKMALVVVLLGLSCGWAIQSGTSHGPIAAESTTVGDGGVRWF